MSFNHDGVAHKSSNKQRHVLHSANKKTNVNINTIKLRIHIAYKSDDGFPCYIQMEHHTNIHIHLFGNDLLIMVSLFHFLQISSLWELRLRTPQQPASSHVMHQGVWNNRISNIIQKQNYVNISILRNVRIQIKLKRLRYNLYGCHLVEMM